MLLPFVDQFVVQAVAPLWQSENALARSMRGVGNFFKTKQSLIAENLSLKERIVSLEVELAATPGAHGSEEELLNLLGRREDPNSIVSTVVTRPPQTPYDVIIIDAGDKDGIALASRVSMPEGPLLGLVSEVYLNNSKVKLYSANNEKTSAILERHTVPVELVGAGAGNFKVVVPRDIEVQVGDRILSADVNAKLIAVVEEVNVEPTDSFQEVLATSPTNIFALRFVFITP